MKFSLVCSVLIFSACATASAQPRPGSFTTIVTTGAITDGTTLTVNGTGQSAFSAGQNGQQVLLIRNTTSAGGAAAVLKLGNNLSTDTTMLQSYSSTFAASGARFADGSALIAGGAGGLSIVSSTNSNLGVIRFYIADGATEAMRIFTSSGVTIGGTTDAGAKSLAVDGGGLIRSIGVAFGSLPSVVNGAMIFCTTCTPASSPCTGGGSGSMAFGQNSAWKCF